MAKDDCEPNGNGNFIITVDGKQVYRDKVPSLLDILDGFSQWKNVYDQTHPDIKGLMTENVIDHFHAHTVDTVVKLNHAGYTPEQISMETGLMPVKIEVVFDHLGVKKEVSVPSEAVAAQKPSILPPCHLWEVKHSYYGEAQYNEMNFDTWEEFIDEMGNADKDYNYLIRWDWHERDRELDIVTYKGDDNERTGHVVFIYHAQRKGFTMSAEVKVCRNDEPKVRAYLEDNWKHMESMWAPVSGGEAERIPAAALAPRTPEQLVENKYTEIMYGDDASESRQTVKDALGDFDPNKVNWVKYRFKTTYDRIAPVIFPPAGPFWEDRIDAAVGQYEVTAYLPEGVPIEQYWPNVTLSAEPVPYERIVYPFNSEYRDWNSRPQTRKPEWWPY